MAKEILFDSKAREALKRGVDALSNAVKVTLGPKGRNVIIEKLYGPPVITKDGVTVAREIDLDDPLENMGAQLVKQVASKTGDLAGDGTTTATVLAQAIFTAGIRNVTAGANPMDIKRGIDKAVAQVVTSLKKQSTEINDPVRIEQVATISANNDASIGELIAEAVKKVGRDGVITIEEAKSVDTSITVVEGMQFDQGYLSPHFVNDASKMEVVYEKPYILIHDRRITMMKDLIHLLDQIVETRRPLVVISDGMDGEALATLILNNVRKVLQVVAVKAPMFGDQRRDMLEDIAAVTGGTLISEEKGLKLEDVTLEQLGETAKIIIGKNSTTLVGGKGKKPAIKDRVQQLNARIKNLEITPFEEKNLRQRLARLTGGVAVIHVGAASEVEMREKMDRFDDALHATRAAIEEGIVPGGGVAYVRTIPSVLMDQASNGDEITGMQIVKKALEEPLRQIVENAGIDGAVVLQKVRDGKKDYGFNAYNGNYENLLISGVIDPTKVTRVALENAASVAGMMLTTECVITIQKEEREQFNKISK